LKGQLPTERPVPSSRSDRKCSGLRQYSGVLDQIDPTQCGPIQLDYVNETRGFVMELGFHHGPDHAKLSS
jgi:hypothetical protein